MNLVTLLKLSSFSYKQSLIRRVLVGIIQKYKPRYANVTVDVILDWTQEMVECENIFSMSLCKK